jgi:hypothetical protein
VRAPNYYNSCYEQKERCINCKSIIALNPSNIDHSTVAIRQAEGTAGLQDGAQHHITIMINITSRWIKASWLQGGRLYCSLVCCSSLPPCSQLVRAGSTSTHDQPGVACQKTQHCSLLLCLPASGGQLHHYNDA